MKEEIKEYINNKCEDFSDGKEVGEELVRLLSDDSEESKEVIEELAHYIEKEDFLCKSSIQGYTIVDIMIWQMDHFKAFLDRDTIAKRTNKSEMIIKAFLTFALMKKNPERYLRPLTEESGSDYDGKFN